MKFECRKCCDGVFNNKPCVIAIPKDIGSTREEIKISLTKCPMEGITKTPDGWERNGKVFDADWRECK